MWKNECETYSATEYELRVNVLCRFPSRGCRGQQTIRQICDPPRTTSPPENLSPLHLVETKHNPKLTYTVERWCTLLHFFISYNQSPVQPRSMGPLLVSENLSNIPAVPTLALPLNSPAGGGHIFCPLVILAGAMVIFSWWWVHNVDSTSIATGRLLSDLLCHYNLI